jgi:hypothetical protein
MRFKKERRERQEGWVGVTEREEGKVRKIRRNEGMRETWLVGWSERELARKE